MFLNELLTIIAWNFVPIIFKSLIVEFLNALKFVFGTCNLLACLIDIYEYFLLKANMFSANCHLQN